MTANKITPDRACAWLNALPAAKAQRIDAIDKVLMSYHSVAVSPSTIAEDIGQDWCTKPDGSPYGAQVYALLAVMPSARSVVLVCIRRTAHQTPAECVHQSQQSLRQPAPGRPPPGAWL